MVKGPGEVVLDATERENEWEWEIGRENRF